MKKQVDIIDLINFIHKVIWYIVCGMIRLNRVSFRKNVETRTSRILFANLKTKTG